jgi:hypothetical protein
LKPLKLPNEDKAFSTLAKRIIEAESKLPAEKTEREETRSAYYRKCAELREARIAEYEKIMTYEEALHLCWCMSTDYEIGKPYELRLSPEERYQRRKKDWQHHDTSWFKRKVSIKDENSCNYLRCIPACRYYPESGRIEDDEITQEHEEYWTKQRKEGEEMLAQKKREHEEWLALTDEERQERIDQQIVERKEEEAWNMANQRGELGPINQRKRLSGGWNSIVRGSNNNNSKECCDK